MDSSDLDSVAELGSVSWWMVSFRPSTDDTLHKPSLRSAGGVDWNEVLVAPERI